MWPGFIIVNTCHRFYTPPQTTQWMETSFFCAVSVTHTYGKGSMLHNRAFQCTHQKCIHPHYLTVYHHLLLSSLVIYHIIYIMRSDLLTLGPFGPGHPAGPLLPGSPGGPVRPYQEKSIFNTPSDTDIPYKRPIKQLLPQLKKLFEAVYEIRLTYACLTACLLRVFIRHRCTCWRKMTLTSPVTLVSLIKWWAVYRTRVRACGK